MEHDRVVDAVEELRAEVQLEGLVDLLLHALVARDIRVLHETNGGLAKIGGTEVRRHDQNRVLEVDRATLRVGQSTVFQDLQQRVEHVGVRLFDLVEEHDRERLAANGLGQLATLVVAHVPGGRTHESAHGVLFHVLGHVELDDGVLVVKEELRQGLGEFGLAHARGAEEDERAAGTLGVLQTRARAPDGSADRSDRLVLTNDALVQLVFHAKQLGGLLLGEAVDRDAGPVRQDLGDGLFVHEIEGLATRGLDRRVEFILLGDELALLLFEGLGLFERALFHGRLFVRAHAQDVLVVLLRRGRCRHATDP